MFIFSINDDLLYIFYFFIKKYDITKDLAIFLELTYCFYLTLFIMFKHILVPIDFSQQAMNAIEAAADLAKQTGAKVELLNVITLSIAVRKKPSRRVREY